MAQFVQMVVISNILHLAKPKVDRFFFLNLLSPVYNQDHWLHTMIQLSGNYDLPLPPFLTIFPLPATVLSPAQTLCPSADRGELVSPRECPVQRVVPLYFCVHPYLCFSHLFLSYQTPAC